MPSYLRFNLAQMLLLMALAGLLLAMGTAVFQRLRGLEQPVAVCYSPDGKAVAVRMSDGTVQVWDTEGRSLGSVALGRNWFGLTETSVFQLIDQETLITTDTSGRFQRWHIPSGKVSTFGGGTAPTFSGARAVSGDGRRAASLRLMAATRSIDVWDATTGRPLRRITGPLGASQYVALSRDGNLVAVLDNSGSVAMWRVESGERVPGQLPGTGSEALDHPAQISFTPDMEKLARINLSSSFADSPYYVEVVDTQTGQAIGEFGRDLVPDSIDLSPDGSSLAAMYYDGEVRVWNVATEKLQGKIAPLAADDDSPLQINSLAIGSSLGGGAVFSPDGKSLLVGTTGKVTTYDAATLRPTMTFIKSRPVLGGGFFAPFLIAWAITWGVVGGRRERQEQELARQRAEREAIASAESTTETLPATAEEIEFLDADEPAPVAPNDDAPLDPAQAEAAIVQSLGAGQTAPRKLILVWAQMFAGGVVAVLWGMYIVFGMGSCYAFLPFPYIAVMIGVLTIARGSGRRTTGLTRTAFLQSLNIVCADGINLVLGIFNFGLLQDEQVRLYLASRGNIRR